MQNVSSQYIQKHSEVWIVEHELSSIIWNIEHSADKRVMLGIKYGQIIYAFIPLVRLVLTLCFHSTSPFTSSVHSLK